MARGLDCRQGRQVSRRQRWRRRAAYGAVLLGLAAVLWAAGPHLAAGALAVPQWLLECMAPQFEARLQTLYRENRTLRMALAEAVPLAEENAALRELVHSAARPQDAALQPARVTAWAPGRMTLFCADACPAVGAAVLDRYGHYAGQVVTAQGHTLVAAVPGTPACLAGDTAGILEAGSDGWSLAGLPLPTSLAEGALVTTADGFWVGLLAAAPTPDAGGLAARAPLTDTALTADTVYFVANG